jgi:hypothetical protein
MTTSWSPPESAALSSRQHGEVVLCPRLLEGLREAYDSIGAHKVYPSSDDWGLAPGCHLHDPGGDAHRRRSIPHSAGYP